MIAESGISLLTPVTPKNWLFDFEVYETTPVVLSLNFTNKSPLVANPIVESTSRTVRPIPALPISLVFDWTPNAP